MIKLDFKVSFWTLISLVVLVFGLYASYLRFFHGLGASTNLSDSFPWGLWIGFDVLVGVGLAAGGFTVAATVHIFNLGKYECISRPAILTAFMGYLLVCVALVFDIGRPLRLWHPLIMWNPHSVMFEVAWCVTLYTAVLALEFSPLVFEKLRLQFPLRIIRAIYLPLVIVGVLLSTLHQSSLGTVYLIVPDKLHGLWYSPLLPIFFFLSAIAAGLSMTIIESFLSARAFRKELEHDVLCGLSRVVVVTSCVFLVWRFLDLNSRNNLNLALEYSSFSVMFWVEVLVGLVIPPLILVVRRNNLSSSNLFFSSLLVVIGFTLNRLNVSITGMINSEEYFPKWSEIAVTLSMVVLGFLLFRLAVKHLPVFENQLSDASAKSSLELRTGLLPINRLVSLWIFFAIAAIAYWSAPSKLAVMEAQGDKTVLMRKADPFETKLVLIPKGKIIGEKKNEVGPVRFRHSTHVDSTQSPGCLACHSDLFSLSLAETSLRLKGEEWHGIRGCGFCHAEDNKAFPIDNNCETCHEE